MTARLRLADGIEPVGQHMADLAVLWCELLDGGPSFDDMAHVALSPEQGGQITVHFTEVEPLIAWAEHLGGLGFVREHVGGRTHILTAAGPVTRGQRTALVRLRSSYTERGAA